jgi:hypothetical protein
LGRPARASDRRRDELRVLRAACVTTCRAASGPARRLRAARPGYDRGPARQAEHHRGLSGLASGAAVQAAEERRVGTITASASAGLRVSKADRVLASDKQHRERRDAARWPYLLRAGRMAACCLSAGRVGDNVESEFQGPHTEALQCAGYYESRNPTLREHSAVPRRGDPLSACPVARGESARGGGCRAWAPTDQ